MSTNGNGKERGKVKWFSSGRGYGFISRPDGAEDVFVHYSDIQGNGGFKTLRENQEVEFSVVSDAKGLKATNVVILGPPARA